MELLYTKLARSLLGVQPFRESLGRDPRVAAEEKFLYFSPINLAYV